MKNGFVPTLSLFLTMLFSACGTDATDSFTSLSVVDPMQLETPVLARETKLLSWTAIENASNYCLKINGSELLMFANHFSLDYNQPIELTISVLALGNNVSYLDSEWSNIVNYIYECPSMSVTGSTPNETFPGGSGTRTDPYWISNLEELSYISLNLSASYELICDIDMQSSEWTPIGSSSQPFSGTLFGGGHSIKNLFITKCQHFVGLFSQFSGTIDSVSLVNPIVRIDSVSATFKNCSAGAFAGNVNDGLFENCSIIGGKVSVLLKNIDYENDYYAFAGGFAGEFISGLIENCFSSCEIESRAEGWAYIYAKSGGFVGYLNGISMRIRNSFLSATVTSYATSNVPIGSSWSSTVSTFVNTDTRTILDFASDYYCSDKTISGRSVITRQGTSLSESAIMTRMFTYDTLGWSNKIWIACNGEYPELIKRAHLNDVYLDIKVETTEENHANPPTLTGLYCSIGYDAGIEWGPTTNIEKNDVIMTFVIFIDADISQFIGFGNGTSASDEVSWEVGTDIILPSLVWKDGMEPNTWEDFVSFYTECGDASATFMFS